MGQAKRRGTFEERKAAAIEREMAVKQILQARRSSPKMSARSSMLMAQLASMVVPPAAPREEEQP